jgi:hypothetical protein
VLALDSISHTESASFRWDNVYGIIASNTEQTSIQKIDSTALIILLHFEIPDPEALPRHSASYSAWTATPPIPFRFHRWNTKSEYRECSERFSPVRVQLSRQDGFSV